MGLRETTSQLILINLLIRNHSFKTYAKFSEKLTFLTPRYGHVLIEKKMVCAFSFKST